MIPNSPQIEFQLSGGERIGPAQIARWNPPYHRFHRNKRPVNSIGKFAPLVKAGKVEQQIWQAAENGKSFPVLASSEQMLVERLHFLKIAIKANQIGRIEPLRLYEEDSRLGDTMEFGEVSDQSPLVPI